jgi:hypothetical protein
MDLQRFLMMLHGSSIWFSRIDRFDDVFEGSISDATRYVMPYGSHVTSDMIEQFNRTWEWLKQWTFATCWHQADRENALMWSAYATSGVAIRTTYARLAEQLPSNAFLAPVMYKDYSCDVVAEGSHIRYFSKRHFFEDEQEVRAVIVDAPSKEQCRHDLEETNPNAGRAIPVDLATLLDAVVCRPFAPTDEVQMVRDVCHAAKLVAVPVVESQLSGQPILN